jgi:L-cysteate sulfo-lyase
MSTTPWHEHSRFTLGHWPTPLEPLERLSEELGGPMIWIKRDDCTGLAIGGNKTRKLEFLIGAAKTAGADTVMTFGAVQSNHARQTAAACAKAGLDCHLVLSRQVASADPAYESGGNVLLGKLLGAHLHIVDADQIRDYTKQLRTELANTGRQTYLIPAGGSNAVGALGYALCAEELQQQSQQLGINLTNIIHASSSAGTQAGLIFGFQQLDLPVDITGINVYHPDPAQLEQRVRDLHQEMTETYSNASASGTASDTQKVNVNHAYIGEGYGQPTAECLEAIKMVAAMEGILFDPVYSGKALAATIDQITVGTFSHTSDVILIHTGGTPALNVYGDAFA